MSYDKWKIKSVNVSDIVGAKLNANSMSKKLYAQLVENIRKSGLSSTISCYLRKEDKKYVIISGHHRYKACVQLGYNTLNILYANEDDLTRDEIIAIQLSHNTLHGDDDKGILKRLFDEISSIDYKKFAHVDVDDLEIGEGFVGSIVPVSEHYKVGLVLYRRDMELLEELFEIVREEKTQNDMVILADGEENEDKFLDTITAVKEEFDIKSVSIAFGKILSLANEMLVTKVTHND